MGKYLIVLVHGTFAHNTEWIHEGSVLWRSLVRELSSDVQIISFPWSGKNSHARIQECSADMLGKQLTKHQYAARRVHILSTVR